MAAGSYQQGTGISEDEAALYDRQIRLWGVEAQNKMRSASVLLVNFGALAAEIAKNIVLAGIGSLTLLDDTLVEAKHLGSNYFLREDDIGKNRGEAAVERVQLLNPRVTMKADSKRSLLQEESYLSTFDIIVVSDPRGDEARELNERTRRLQRKMFACAVSGTSGWAFADLLSHEYLVNEVTLVGHGETKTSQVKKQATYPPLESALGHSFAKQKARTLRKLSAQLWESIAMLVSQDQSPTAANEHLRKIGAPVELTEDRWSQLQQLRCVEYPASIAVLGGLIGQDVLNTIGAKEEPIKNFLVVDGDACTASVHPLAMS